jgi:hypothetical protein
MQPQESAAQFAKATFTATGQAANEVSLFSVEIGEAPGVRPMLCECPLGCGHAHVEHPHLNMMHE